MNNTEKQIYLDNAATSFPKPENVYLTMDRFYRQSGANPGRSGHRLGLEAAAMVERVREKLARLAGTPQASSIVLTFNATDSANLAINGLDLDGGEVLLGSQEHNSLSRPLYELERQGRIKLRMIPQKGALIDPDEVKKLLSPKTRLAAVGHISNVTGAVQPVSEIGAIIHNNSEACFLVDAAQSAGNAAIDVKAMGIDLLIMTGHKSLYGPTGTGALYVKPGLKLKPWRVGGTGSRSEDRFQPDEMPDHLEAGTLNVSGLAGLEAGLDFIFEEGIEKLASHKKFLLKILEQNTASLQGLKIYSQTAEKNPAGLFSFNIENLSAQDSMVILDTEFGIESRGGLHCSPGTHIALGTFPGGTVRLSLGAFNTREEMERVAGSLERIIQEVR